MDMELGMDLNLILIRISILEYLIVNVNKENNKLEEVKKEIYF